jgi:hypothetical protein
MGPCGRRRVCDRSGYQGHTQRLTKIGAQWHCLLIASRVPQLQYDAAVGGGRADRDLRWGERGALQGVSRT